MNNNKEKSKFWGRDTGKEVVFVAWNGTKTIALVVVAAVALGLGFGAMDAASG